MMGINKILVPIDFSNESELAIEWAIRLAKEDKNSTIFLLHVLPYVVDPTYLIGWTDDLVGFRWDQAELDLNKWCQKIPKSISGIPLLRKGQVAEEIEQVCNDKEIDIVIMTTRERRGISRVISPNASEKAVRLAPCPVLVLHLNQKTANAVFLAT